MTESDKAIKRPLWVSLGLCGAIDRNTARIYFWITVANTIGCIAYGYVDSRYFWGATMLPFAWWQYGAVRWIDRRRDWAAG